MTLLDFHEAKAYLRIDGTGDDPAIANTIASAEGALATRVGPLVPVERVERVRGQRMELDVPGPIASLTSVTDADGASVDVAGLFASDAVITRNDGQRFSSRFYTVTYEHGWASAPPALVQAALEMVRHLWQPQRGGRGRPGGQVAERQANTMPGTGYLFPYRVQELIAPFEQAGVS